MRKQNFNARIGLLIQKVREDGELSIGKICLLLNVGDWQAKRYAKVAADISEDIRFDGEKLHTIITPTQQLASQLKLDKFKTS